MELQQKYDILLTRIRRWADLEKSRADVEETSNITCERSEGNANDVFDDGMRAADAYNALECRDLLKAIGELTNEALT